MPAESRIVGVWISSGPLVKMCSRRAGRPQSHSNGDETVTLTKRELTALITEAARLVAREMNR